MTLTGNETFLGKFLQQVASQLHRLELREQIRRERRLLRRIDERTLRDLGISRADAAREAARPARDIPAGRLGIQ